MGLKKDNIVFIKTDQLNFKSIASYGNQTVRTPNIDDLARCGVSFDYAYAPSPSCGPSRASIFSGLYSQSSGAFINQQRYKRKVNLLTESLRENGYQTALVGKLHLSPGNENHGFEYKRLHDAMYDIYNKDEPWESDYVKWLAEKKFEGNVDKLIEKANTDEAPEFNNPKRFLLGSNWRDEQEHSNHWVTNESIEYIRNHKKEPFFLSVSYFGPHQPMAAPEPWFSMYDKKDIKLAPEFYISPDDKPVATTDAKYSVFKNLNWSEDDYKEILAAYYGQISMIDNGIGLIIQELKKEQLLDNTVIIFASDHGDLAGQFGWFTKSNMYEGSVRVPLIIKDPQQEKAAGLRCNKNVNLIDLYKTILNRCGIAEKQKTHSRSLLPLLVNPEDQSWVNETYSEFVQSNEKQLWMAVKDEYKIISVSEVNNEPLYEMYNVHKTPLDGTDLSNDKKYHILLKKMKELLKEKRQWSASLKIEGVK
jgi:arylsulfatase A-like enzyme